MTDLTEKLARGDDEAAARVFRAYEPYLRMVVRQRLTPRLRAKFDSADIVQSVWVDVLDHVRDGASRFEGPTQLRNFLVRATLNRFIDRIRSHRRAVERERPMRSGEVGQVADARGASPSQVEQAEDLWRRMLDLCPPSHRELLQMKRQGLDNAEIAARTGLNPGFVRRILAQLASRIAREGRGG
ncbi:MAG TPA: sigma-70 family RNA polymerase sigma factor [Isosphaeraceae bacterium]